MTSSVNLHVASPFVRSQPCFNVIFWIPHLEVTLLVQKCVGRVPKPKRGVGTPFHAFSPGPSLGFSRRGGQKPAGEAKNQKGDHIFKTQYWMYVATGGAKREMRAPISNRGAGHHCPPAGDDPGSHPTTPLHMWRSKAKGIYLDKLVFIVVVTRSNGRGCWTA